MTKLLLSLHVLAVVLAVGPVAVAASMFPPALRRAQADPHDGDARSSLRTLHRICRVYAGIGIAVPVFGFATAGSLGVLGSAWLIISIVLTGVAAAVLVLAVLPRQQAALESAGAGTAKGAAEAAGAATSTGSGTAATAVDPRVSARLAMFTGVFNLLWATVTVLMIVRPGSTTGA